MVRLPVVGPPKLAKIGRWMAVLIFSNPRATLAGVRPKFLKSTGGTWGVSPHVPGSPKMSDTPFSHNVIDEYRKARPEYRFDALS